MINKRKISIFLTIGTSLVVCIFLILNTSLISRALHSKIERPHVILISLDTLRADRLSIYGYHRGTSPTIDSIASEGTLFENTVSVTSWTLPAHLSLFSGLYPTSHGVTKDNQQTISQEIPVLAEILSEHGYRTFGYHGGGYVSARYGFKRGFEEYDNTELNVAGGRRVKKKNQGFLKTLKKAKETVSNIKPGESFFLFLHTFDIHCPYNPPEPYYSQFKTPKAQKIKTNRCGESFFNKLKLNHRQVNYISDRYDGSIRWADENLKELISFLKEKGLYDKTILIITSDHGEEFHEHGKIGHQGSLHRELIRIPLIMRGPGITPGRSAEMTSLVDVAPTILDLLSLPIPNEMQGHSLYRALQGESQPLPDYRFSELDRQVTLRSYMGDSHHLISKAKDNPQLYDMENDKKEQQDISKTEKKFTEELNDKMTSFSSSLSKYKTESSAPTSEEELKNLKSLGYL